MKKHLIILIILLLISIPLFAYSYHVKCHVCLNDKNREKCYSLPNNAWRDFGIPIIHKDEKAYATYRCAAGHKFLVCLTDEK